jgi:hypothetical protein
MTAMPGLSIVRALLSLIAVAGALVGAGCSRADAPAPNPPTRPRACARAADSMVGALLARLPAHEPPPTEHADALRNLIRERCERDAWSADATRCLIAIVRIADAGRCAELLTEDQQAALVRDQAALAGPAPAPAPATAPP